MGFIISWFFTDPISAGDQPYKYYLPWLIICAIGLLVPFYYSVEARKRFFKKSPLTRYLFDKFMGKIALICFFGPFIAFGRWALDSTFFAWRIWRWGWAATLVIYLLYWVFYLIRRYPRDRAAYAYEMKKREYYPKPKGKK